MVKPARLSPYKHEPNGVEPTPEVPPALPGDPDCMEVGEVKPYGEWRFGDPMIPRRVPSSASSTEEPT